MLKTTSLDFRKRFLLKFAETLIRNSSSEDIEKLGALLKQEKNSKKEEVKKILEKKEKPEEIKELENEIRENKAVIQNSIPLQKKPLEKQTINPNPKTSGKRIEISSESKQQKQLPQLAQKNQTTKTQQKMQPSIMQTQQQKPQAKPVLRQQKPIRRQIQIPSHPQIPQPAIPERLKYIQPVPSKTQEIDLGKLNPLIKDPMVKIIECNGPGENIIVSGGMGVKPTSIILKKEDIEKIMKTFSEKTKIPLTNGIYKVAYGTLIFSAIISEIIHSKFIIKKIPFSNLPQSLQKNPQSQINSPQRFPQKTNLPRGNFSNPNLRT
ncbi:hypothetical protein K9L16_00080 [Candidatus Pacearchaeota archaeon]|nr:hypothetical protein [Candidatus Pacearchaeota archaeon]